MEKKLEFKKLEVELYGAQKDLLADSQNAKKKAVVEDIEKDMEELDDVKKERSSASLHSPTINVRSPTGLSSVRSGGRSRAR